MRKILTSILIFALFFFVFSLSTVSAKVIAEQNGSVTIAKTEVINDDLFVGAQAVDIAGTVNGDVFIGAQTVKITGVINGNLHVGANILDLQGTVKGNVYAAGQSILISSTKIGGSLLAGGATVSVDKDSVIGGSILTGAGTLTIDSQVKRSVYAGTGNLTIGAGAMIGKDLYYAAGNNQVNIAPGAKILGNTYKSEVKTASSSAQIEAAKKELPRALTAIRFGTEIVSFLGALIIGFIYLKLFGKHLSRSAAFVTGSFWKSFGIGFLVSIAFIPGIILLLVTVIGIPVAGLSILMLILYTALSKFVVASSFGTCAASKFKWKMSPYGGMVFGLLIIYLLKLIPIVGFFTGLTVLWTGLGALTLQMFSKVDN